MIYVALLISLMIPLLIVRDRQNTLKRREEQQAALAIAQDGLERLRQLNRSSD